MKTFVERTTRTRREEHKKELRRVVFGCGGVDGVLNSILLVFSFLGKNASFLCGECMCSRSMSVSVSLRLSTTTTRVTTTTRRIRRSFNSAPSSFSRGGGKKKCLRRTVVASLEDNTNTNNGDEASLVNTAHAITSSTPYAVLEGAVVLAILALLDCGWSGDWSRIGAVTQENEAQARWLCVNVVFPRTV